MAYYPLTQGKWPPSSPFTRLAQSAAGKSRFNGFISLQLHSSSQHEFLFDISRLEIQVNTEDTETLHTLCYAFKVTCGCDIERLFPLHFH